MYKKLYTILAALFLTACTQSHILGYRVDDFLFDVKNREWKTIDELGLVNVNLRSIKTLERYLGEGAAYFLALRRYNKEDYKNYEILMTWQMRHGDSIHSVYAAEHLAAYYIDRKNWDRLDVISNSPDTRFRSKQNLEQYRMAVLYRREQYAELLRQFPEHQNMTDESRLYLLVALYKTNNAFFQEKLTDYILAVDDKKLLYRLFLYMLDNAIEIEEQVRFRNLAQARLLAAAEETEAAGYLYRRAWGEDYHPFLERHIFHSFAATVLEEGDHDFFRSSLSALAEMPEAGVRIKKTIFWELGSFERKFSNYSNAVDLYKYIYRNSNDFEQKRALWYWYDCLARGHAEEYPGMLFSLFSKWDDPAWFSDTFEYYSAWLLRNHRYSDLYSFFKILEKKADPYTVTRLVWVMYLLDHYGYYKMPAELKEKVPEYMTADYAGVFYRVLYKVLSTSKDQVKPVNKPNDFSYFYNPGIKQVPERQEQSVLLVSMYIVYQLLEEAYNLSLEKSNVIPTSMLIKLGVMLGNKNEHYKSLQILRLAAERTDFPLDEAMLKALYPLAFKKEIISAATDNKIAEPLFFGLIRAESLFNSEIASWAGAQGLSQLMPATADEVAKRLSLDEYDIHDPQTNLDIGGWYLANVRNRNHDFSRALYAYNAGPSRVDSWNDDIGNYPSLLYLESIPIESTRKYVKRIFVSAQLYNILYFEYDSRHLAELFFSGIGDFIIKQKEAQ